MTIRELHHGQDDQTVIRHRGNETPAQTALTDFTPPAKFEPLDERMIYAARVRPAESFNLSLNPLTGAAATLLSEVVRLKHSHAAEDLPHLREHPITEPNLLEHPPLPE